MIMTTSAAVALGGDMTADSHCVKYGSYTMMDLRSSRVIDIQLIQVLYGSDTLLITLLFLMYLCQ